MDKPKVTPKDFFLWAAAMVALYVSVFSFITLLFQYIDYAYPDALSYGYDPYSGAIRFAIASLIVLFPTFLVLMRFIRSDMERTPEKSELWVRRWALFLTVFVAGASVVVDLITLVNYFLGGDITTRFVLKVLVVLLVGGGFFLHFLADVRGYWVMQPKRARLVGYGAGVVVLAAVIAGFFIMGTPGEIRNYRFDDQKIGDLQNIQWQVVNYWQQKEVLPASLADLNDPISDWTVPTDPQGGEYTYKKTGARTFELCATFNAPTQPNSPYTNVRQPVSVDESIGKYTPDTWTHEAGEQCFERTIDPERYPPFSKTR